MVKIVFALIIFVLGFSACKKPIAAEDEPTEPIPGSIIPNTGALLSFTPNFPSENEALALVYDASKGNAELNNYTGDVYVFTGVITDKSNQASDWKYGQWDWDGTPPSDLKMKSLGDSKYSLEIKDIRAFYKVAPDETVLKIALLFRNADGSKVGRNYNGSDIFLPLYKSEELNVRILSPNIEPTFIPAFESFSKVVGEEIEVKAISSKTANLTLLLNGAIIHTNNNATSISGKISFAESGNQLIEVKASSGEISKISGFEFAVTSKAEQAEIPVTANQDGFTRLNNGTSVIMTLYAPQKEGVFVIGDFNDWKAETAYFMKRSPDGKRWWLQIDGLEPQREYAYQFLVDGSLKIADPYAEKILDPANDGSIPADNYTRNKTYPTGKTTGIVSVFQSKPQSYNWEIQSFSRPEKNTLVIYELHLRDFLKSNNYSTLSDTLSYLKRLGVNALQLMPINEFEGNSSWGYNPSFYFTPDKFYGSPVMLKKLIDQCHKSGIAVILDIVLNHSFGQSPMVQLYFDQGANKPSADNPWFNQNPTHPYNVGYDFNHESAATKLFTKNVLRFWMEEYKIDGYRFDLSKGFTQKDSGEDIDGWNRHDVSRVAIWKEYNRYIKSISPNNFYVILEHFAEDLEEQELSKDGMMLWNNLNHSFNEASMGYLPGSDFSRGFYDTHGFDHSENLISYMESHDEERMMYKNLTYGSTSGAYSVKTLSTALKRQEMAAAFFFTIPGPKMIWQFGELGYDKSINENGRTGEKPILWNYKQNTDRMNLYKTYAKLIALKKDKAVFNTNSFEYKLDGAIKYIILKSANESLFVVGNFDVRAREANIRLPTSTVWYNQLASGQLAITSSFIKELAPGEYYVYSNKGM